MDDSPDPSEVPDKLIELIEGEKTWQELCDKWHEMYPNNRVSGEEDEE